MVCATRGPPYRFCNIVLKFLSRVGLFVSMYRVISIEIYMERACTKHLVSSNIWGVLYWKENATWAVRST